MPVRVAILGGGVAGMTVAHELIERGFEVVVFEANALPGGKARSFPVTQPGTCGRKPLPAEHGFRFFPGFYRHLPNTMERIPFGAGSNVAQNLIAASRTMLARIGSDAVFITNHFPQTLPELVEAFLLPFEFYRAFGIPEHEIHFFACRLLTLLTSCTERRYDEWERKGWWQFLDADNKSLPFQKYLAAGLCKSLVAVQPHEMSTRSGGYILLQFLFDFAKPGIQVDRVLNGPTSDVWIDPWFNYLRARGVDYRTSARVEAIDCDGRLITGVQVVGSGGIRSRETADYYVAAVPFEAMVKLTTPTLLKAEPRLAGLASLKSAWMTGLMFYLKRDVPVVNGHINFVDSSWSLTGISQPQFWPGLDLAGYDAGEVHGIISTIISDWETPGLLYHKPASQCTLEEIKSEVWEQMKRHLNDNDQLLKDEDLHLAYLDPAIIFAGGIPKENRERLLVNTVSSWNLRPEATTSIENFFLASDYVRTFTDMATMESANEAGRRAVNGLLAASGSSVAPCAVWPLSEPDFLEPAREHDLRRYRSGLPHEFPFWLWPVCPGTGLNLRLRAPSKSLPTAR
jgi:uncharacterized protein with NAD-binding domain and iron-sulfur cluster